MKLKKHFERLNKLIGQYNIYPQTNLGKDTYKPLIVAAFSKCFEFNLFLQRLRNERNSFFYSPFLRGVCEDIITLKYFDKHFKEDRDELCVLFLQLLMMQSIKAQQEFFKKQNVLQAYVVNFDADKKIKEYEDKMKSIMAKNSKKPDKVLPNIKSMAIDAGLKDLYEFMYHATSKTVHFSPNILLRMGWYKDNEPYTFSSHNFDSYYHKFNQFWAAYLFVEFSNYFKNPLGLKQDFMYEVKEISNCMNEFSYHPELVTFEELNKKRPDDFLMKFLAPMLKKDKSPKEKAGKKKT